ncbi:MAG: BTAD domain-containing putative transcriptional regulator [Chloroflexota bacterium]
MVSVHTQAQPDYQIRLFGPFQLSSAEKKVRFRSKRIIALLSHIICQQRPVSRTVLANLIWPEKCEKVGRTNVRWAINQITKHLPNCLHATRDTVTFVGTPEAHIDILGLREAIKLQDLDLLESRLLACQGQLLEGFFFDESADFETWLHSVRQTWWGKILQSATNLIQLYLQKNQPARALNLAQHLLSLEGSQEAIHRLAMQAFIELGHYDEALAQFERCQQVLSRELGVSPDAKTVTLYQQIHQRKAYYRVEAPITPLDNASSSMRPLHVLYHCYGVLQASGDSPLASQILALAYQELRRREATLDDGATQALYLDDTIHQRIIQDYEG